MISSSSAAVVIIMDWLYYLIRRSVRVRPLTPRLQSNTLLIVIRLAHRKVVVYVELAYYCPRRGLVEMSQQQQIQRYLNELSDLRRISGEARESIVSEAFKTLLKDLGRSKNLIFIPQYKLDTGTDRRYVDGALLYELRVPFGYWEAKDEADDLDEEIERKFRRGYPQDNIIFEDSREAILIQDRRRVARCRVDDPDSLGNLLALFFRHERKEIVDFRKAVDQFKTDLPAVLEQLRSMIETAEVENSKFSKASIKFLKHAQDTINPTVSAADVREMLIQHILTEEIFSQVFDNSDFHRQNNVAKELYALEGTFFIGKIKHDTLAGLRPYYAAIKSAAALVSSHHEKQTFLKTIYEGFYKVYNKKAADRLGVVYTPNEIVRFMIESAEWLCQKNFAKSLIDRNVEILDPAVGTGTFITELIEHFRGQPTKLRYKYLEELHANEVAILPYYVANLNIEATYAAILGEYEEYENLCFVDTLDNVGALRALKGQHFADLFGSVTEENVERINRQNKRKISIVIGNPPYNANQANENDNNKNREYPIIDERIKQTYIKASTAQKTKLYDMYARFFRWASDRVDLNGIVAFITNRSFIESRTFDGFRKLIAEEFNEIYIVDLGGDVRVDPRLSGTRNNVFGIQTGVAISFLVKRDRVKGSKIYYARRPQLETAEDKLSFLEHAKLENIEFETIRPSVKNNWLHLSENDFDSLLPTANKETKLAKSKYALNLRREFPRIPFYKDFHRWADWGKELMDLHIDFEEAKPWPVKRKKGSNAGGSEAILRLDKEAGTLHVDSEVSLTGFPPSAWDYKLGNRSPVETRRLISINHNYKLYRAEPAVSETKPPLPISIAGGLAQSPHSSQAAARLARLRPETQVNAAYLATLDCATSNPSLSSSP
jgi:hypothetical protein